MAIYIYIYICKLCKCYLILVGIFPIYIYIYIYMYIQPLNSSHGSEDTNFWQTRLEVLGGHVYFAKRQVDPLGPPSRPRAGAHGAHGLASCSGLVSGASSHPKPPHNTTQNHPTPIENHPKALKAATPFYSKPSKTLGVPSISIFCSDPAF